MIKYNPTRNDIELACMQIEAHGDKPIIYCSITGQGRLMELMNLMPLVSVLRDEVSGDLPAYHGYCGRFEGIPVYVTEEAEDAIIIVPRYEEKTI